MPGTLPPKWKMNDDYIPTAPLRRMHTPGSPLGVLEAAYSTPGKTASSHILDDKEGCQFWWGPRAGKGSVAGPAEQVAMLYGPYDLAEPMVFEVSVVGKRCLWSLWHNLVGEYRPLGFWGRAMPSVARNNTFQKIAPYLLQGSHRDRSFDHELSSWPCSQSGLSWAGFCQVYQAIRSDKASSNSS